MESVAERAGLEEQTVWVVCVLILVSSIRSVCRGFERGGGERGVGRRVDGRLDGREIERRAEWEMLLRVVNSCIYFTPSHFFK